MYIWKARPSSASNAIYGRIKCTLCSHDIPCNMISDQEKNITARKSRWLTSMRLTDLPVWPSLRRLPGREGNGQGRQLEPYLAGCFLVRVAARILLQQISQVWKPRAEYEDSTSRYETRCYTGTSLVVQWLRVHIPDSGAQVWSQVRELDPTSHR